MLDISNISTKNVITLKDSVLLEIKKSDKLRIAIMDQRGVKETTVLKWLRDNSSELTKLNTLLLIGSYLKKEIQSLIN